MTIVLWGIVTSLSVYGHVHLSQKTSLLQEQQETFVIQMNAESDYIVSKEAKLLETPKTAIQVSLIPYKENH